MKQDPRIRWGWVVLAAWLGRAAPAAQAPLGDATVATQGELTLGGLPEAFRCRSGPETRLLCPGAEAGDGFGSAVAMLGDTLFVGAPGADDPLPDTGAVHVFGKLAGEWWHTATLVPSDPLVGQGFGRSLAVDDSMVPRLVVGCPEDSLYGFSHGSVHVFEDLGLGWEETATLRPDPLSTPGAGYGFSVDLEGDRIVVGAPFEERTVTTGNVYVHELDAAGAWPAVAALSELSFVVNGYFGLSVDLRGDRIAVGIPSLGQFLAYGKAQLFRRAAAGWVLEGTVGAGVERVFDGFGYSVALTAGNGLVVGAPYGGDDPGSAWTYRLEPGSSSWVTMQHLMSPRPSPRDRFGLCLESRGSQLLVTADSAVRRGGARLYWTSAGVPLLGCDAVRSCGVPGEGFGASGAFAQGVVAVGAPGHGGAGAVYLFE